MRFIKIVAAAVFLCLGVFLVVFGEKDDSPGAQGLGALIAIGSLVVAVRSVRNR